MPTESCCAHQAARFSFPHDFARREQYDTRKPQSAQGSAPRAPLTRQPSPPRDTLSSLTGFWDLADPAETGQGGAGIIGTIRHDPGGTDI